MENIALEPIISAIIYIIPLGTLIWKASQLSSRVSQNEKDIEMLKGDLKKQNAEILNSLQKINETMAEIKTEVEVIKAMRKQEVENK